MPLEHLLTNNSGILDRLSQAITAHPGLPSSTAGSAAMISRFGSGRLAFETGAKFDYAFFDWVLIHALLEQVTGKPSSGSLWMRSSAHSGSSAPGLSTPVVVRCPGLLRLTAAMARLRRRSGG